MNYHPRILYMFVIVFPLAAVVTPSQVMGVESLSDLTGPWQLFVDDYLIADKTNVVRRYHPFEKYSGNPVMVADKPWKKGKDRSFVTAGTVLPTEDGTEYRMWHYCARRALYSISKDGINWKEPNLGIIPGDNGSTNNNFLKHSVHPIHTPWNTDPKRRYTSMNRRKGGYRASFSEDGINWQASTKEPQILDGSDVGFVNWDPHTRQYRVYVKIIRDVSGLRRRCVGFAATTDVESWPPLELVLAPDDFDDRWVEEGTVQRTHFYGCPVFSYETMYLGLLWIFRAEDELGYFHGPVFAELVTSRDGIHWLREEGDRPRLLDIGPPGSWDDGMVYASPIMVEGDTIRLYYTGADEGHDLFHLNGGAGLATLRKDGFASLDAKRDGGEFSTKRLKGAKGPLRINYKTTWGSLKVEVLDTDGNVLTGYSRDDCNALQGDSIDQVVTWGTSTELPANVDPLRLRFVMKNASLYSFMAGDNVQIIDELVTEPILAVLCTFEEDPKKQATDKLSKDGVQTIRFHGHVHVDKEPDNAAFGNQSVEIGSRFRPINKLEIGGTSKLGTSFTLAAMVKSKDNQHARLFST
ncbi:MAG: hypothetical protein ACYTF1_11400, partial [Planctomycetota bacterium]